MKNNDYSFTAILIIAQVLVSVVAFLVLMAVFQFPDILRENSSVRLALFVKNQDVIIPTYYLLALTGIMNAMIASLIFYLFEKKSAILVLALVFGILTGIFQAIGFIRWSFLIPYLANLQESSSELIPVLEGAFNAYAGMAIGENLGFVMQGLWTLCLSIAFLQNKYVSNTLGKYGITIGILTVLMAFETFGGSLSILAELTNPVESAWYIWLVFIAISIYKKEADSNYVSHFGIKSFIAALIVWLNFVIPAYI
ncbi:MAG: DUF4386 family protein [Arcobacter sp.]|nr:DUF4386 family protein [Arcobacter sp.]